MNPLDARIRQRFSDETLRAIQKTTMTNIVNMFHGMRIQDAEDITADVILKMLQLDEEIKEPNAFATIAGRRAVLNFLKKSQKTFLLEAPEMAALTETPDETFQLSEEDQSAVGRALDIVESLIKSRSIYDQTILKCKAKGWTAEMIAVEVERTPAAVRKQWSRILHEMKNETLLKLEEMPGEAELLLKGLSDPATFCLLVGLSGNRDELNDYMKSKRGIE